MDSLEEDNVRMDVKSLVSAFTDKELAGMSADSKNKAKREKKHLASVSERSYEIGTPHFGEKKPGSKHRSSASERSYEIGTPHFSEKNPLAFASERSYEIGTPHFGEKKPGYKHRSSASERSYEIGTPHFSEKNPLAFASERSYEIGTPHFGGERPDDYTDYKTEVDVPNDIDDKVDFRSQTPKSTFNGGLTGKYEEPIEDPPLKGEQKTLPYGIPQRWGGHMVSSLNSPKLMAHPPAVVFPVLTTNQRVDFFHNSRNKPEKAESTISDSFDSSTRTPGRRDSHFGERTYDDIQEEVICDICCQAPAVKTCLTCNSSYCLYDVQEHYTVKTLQRHLLRDVSEKDEGKRCRHYVNPLDFFCWTDQMLICSICAQGNHRGHDIVSHRAPRTASQISDADQKPNPGIVVPPPGKIKFLTAKPNSVVLSWGCPKGLDGTKRFRLQWKSSLKEEGCLVVKDLLKIEINSLQIGQKYVFSVATEDEDGNLSEWITASACTALPAPRHLTKVHSEAKAFSLKWTKGDNMEGIPHQYLVRVTSPGKEQLAVYTEDCFKIFSDLEPDTEYAISVSTVLNDQCSESISTTIITESHLTEVLSKIGLEDQYDNKLTLSSVLEINQYDTPESKLGAAQSLPEAFLRKLMMLSANARNVRCLPPDVDSHKSFDINPLDLTIALFLCSDSFLHQIIVLKMSLCQFAIPLLLPNYETRQLTLMLWSMREVVRSFRPSSYAFRKSSCEERIVLSDVPLVSFVRLRRTAWSKSQMLNKLLRNTQQHHDTFYHRDMVCGDVPRRISEGLVEISWCLPSGDRNVDRFAEPLAVANLRGDIRAFDKQFSFLCQTSAAVYIFCDESEADYFKNLEGKDVKANLILISSVKGQTVTLKTMTVKPSLKTKDVSKKKKTETELVKALQESISKMLENHPNTVSVANMADRARRCGILVDEDIDECQSACKNADKITKQVTNTSAFKDKHLASQGFIWKVLSWLETEGWRLRKVGNQNTEDYRNSLKTKANELRRKQLRFQMTAAMSSFLHGMVASEVERYYFLKWLGMDLDNLTRGQLSALQDRYKEQRQKLPQHTEKMAEIDKQISVCSLRLEHFFRECGQLYECASYLPEQSRKRKTVERLPAVCAQMLLDGFPLELVDGDTANIPLKWISEVLTELHYIMHSDSKLKVVTVIGAENWGKSTLLNTMFGVSFATGRGTCTRGAFMQLIGVNKDVREELGCDCIVIIDTEGLKPHQMVQDDHSHERDEEVASLAVALSDVTIVNLTTDDPSEEGVLEMVCHAFARSKGEGTTPLCHFVRISMSDKPAVERRNTKGLVEKLNKIIQKNTRMKKADVTKISDVMEFDPDTCSWHIPALWHGTPPMAPVSGDYSEIVHALKNRLLQDLKKCQERGDLTDFIGRVENLWKTL